jgi:hypothetical protein
MQLVKEYINEKFTEDSDPVHDMNIGIKPLMEKWLKQHNIANYVIKDDLTIDVQNNLQLIDLKESSLPEYINFGYVYGKLECLNNNFTTMRGFPKKIGRFANINYNKKLRSLEFLPQEIMINDTNYKYTYGYGLLNNNIKSFVGLPEIIAGSLWIQKNPVNSLEGFPKIIKGNLWIDHRFSLKQITDICQVNGNINLV